MTPRLLLLLPSTTYRAAAFVEAAHRIGIALTVASDHSSVFARAQPENLLALDFADPGRAAVQARAFAARHPIAAVFGVDDDTALLASHVAAALRLPHNPPEATRAARDKHLQRVMLARFGLPVPPFALHRFDEDLPRRARAAPFPCVLKPTRLAASRGVIRADTPEQYLAAVATIRRILQPDGPRTACAEGSDVYLVERYVEGPEVALEGLLEDGQLRVLALFDKPDPLEGPTFEETIYATPSRLDEAQQRAIAWTAEQAARALGLASGPIHAELRVNARGVWLIELAARPIGGRCGAVLRFGEDGAVSLEELLLRRALGLPVASHARESRAAAVLMIPTRERGVLAAVEGVDAARATPLVEDVVITINPGQELVPLPEGSRYLGFIYARAGTPEAAVAALRAAHARLLVRLR